MSSSTPHNDPPSDDEAPEMIDLEEVEEEVALEEDDGDVDMSDGEDDGQDHPDEEIQLVNDSIAYFDAHKDSVFTIAQHPTNSAIIATGGSEGDADDAPGKGYVFFIPSTVGATTSEEGPVLPPSYAADPGAAARDMQQKKKKENTQLVPAFSIDGHTDSINALAFTLPAGDFLVSGGLDGRLRAYAVADHGTAAPSLSFLAESQEVPEINWLAPCPSAQYPNAVALGASDGSVWVYAIEASPDGGGSPLQIVQSHFLHTGACTAGAWTPDGNLLATVDEESSLYVWDVWGLAAARGATGDNGQTVVSLTGADQRFHVEGGLYSVAVEPRGGFLAAGGHGGAIRIVGLPRLSDAAAPQGGKAGGKAKAGKAGGKAGGGGSDNTPAGAGQILAALQVQSDSIETLSFAPSAGPSYPPLLAAGSVDGSIAVYDPSRSFAIRRQMHGAHDDFSVVRVEWVRQPPSNAATGQQQQWLLTSCGMDGVVRRWNLQGASPSQHAPNAAVQGLEKEWRGHRGDGEGGGVLGFVQGLDGKGVVTAGDDGLVLVFQV